MDERIGVPATISSEKLHLLGVMSSAIDPQEAMNRILKKKIREMIETMEMEQMLEEETLP